MKRLIGGSGGGGGGTPGGSPTQVQFNDGGAFGGDAGLVYDKTTNKLTAGGDVELNDGGTYTTTLQTITPTANRTVSLPDATGTVALVAGSSGQLVYNNAGAQAGAPGSVVGATGDITLTLNGAASTPPLDITGTWFTGGTSTTTKPQVLIEPAGTTSTAWSTSGTGLGVNAVTGFTGRLLDLQVNGTSRAVVTGAGNVGIGTSSPQNLLDVAGNANIGATSNTVELTLGAGATGNRTTLIDFVADTTYTDYGLRIARQGSGPNSASVLEHRGTGDLRFNSVEAGSLTFLTTSTERARIKASGVVNLSSAPTYADNAAALAGGLVAGDVYKTATGELRITV